MPDRTRRPSTTAGLDVEAQITPSDLARVRALWRRVVPGPLKHLLDAKVQEDGPPPPPPRPGADQF